MIARDPRTKISADLLDWRSTVRAIIDFVSYFEPQNLLDTKVGRLQSRFKS